MRIHCYALPSPPVLAYAALKSEIVTWIAQGIFIAIDGKHEL